jgi:dienelactone hydrolase
VNPPTTPLRDSNGSKESHVTVYRSDQSSLSQRRKRLKEQLADWQAAITFAASLPDIDPSKLAIWGFSGSGGHVFAVGASNSQLAAPIAHAPLADGPANAPNAIRHITPLALAG